MTDSEMLKKMEESLKTEAYDFGSFIEYNGLDVQNLKHPFFEKEK